MNHPAGVAALTSFLVVLGSAAATAGEMTAELKIDRSNSRCLQTKFGNYGYRDRQAIFPEAAGIRIWLPPRVPDIHQTGIYSYFALAGDCEVTLTYEILALQPSPTSRGSSVGLALEIGDSGTQGDIRRMNKPGNESGLALHSGVKGKAKDENRFVPGTAKKGRIGLRRIKKELIFLASDDTAGELQEIDRLPFTDETIRTVRFFADPGGSQAGVDVRFRDITFRAEEITAGVAQKDAAESGWWWWMLVIIPVAGVGIFWLWRVRRRRCEDA